MQGFALAQTPKASLQSGNFGYLKPYYTQALALQNAGAQPSFGTVSTNKLTYQAEFGTQQAAMTLMGTWYIATLLSQQASGDANTFPWGIAPAPQLTASTTGTSHTPITFGDPTGFGINPAIDRSKIAAAKEFPRLCRGAAGRQGTGWDRHHAGRHRRVAQEFFSLKGMPTDALSKFAFSTHDTKPENPVSKYTAAIAEHPRRSAHGDHVRQHEHRQRDRAGAEPGQERGPQPVTGRS